MVSATARVSLPHIDHLQLESPLAGQTSCNHPPEEASQQTNLQPPRPTLSQPKRHSQYTVRLIRLSGRIPRLPPAHLSRRRLLYPSVMNSLVASTLQRTTIPPSVSTSTSTTAKPLKRYACDDCRKFWARLQAFYSEI